MAPPEVKRPRTPRHAEEPGGLGTSIAAALQAGWLAGSLFGLGDGIVAGLRTGTEGWRAWASCLGLAVVTYGLIWCGLLGAFAFVAHAFLARKPRTRRVGAFLALGLGLGLFLELYWWTRPYVYYGVPAVDPKRLLAAGGMALGALGLGWLVALVGRALPSPLKLLGWLAIAAAWAAGCVSVVQLQVRDVKRGEINERNRELPNVLLFVVDALRADVLGCYGNPRVKTPVIDALAARGVLFENAIAQAPFTWSSFGSILTGKYPRRHGLVKMESGHRMRPNITLAQHLKSARLESGGELRDGDYYGATFLTGTLSNGSGLMQGFDAYYEALVGHELVQADEPWSVFRSELVLSLLRNKVLQRFDAQRVASVASDWLAHNGERRFVSLVHFYSTHTPYDPPAEFRRMYVDPAYRGQLKTFYADARIAIEKDLYRLDEADQEQIRNLYYAGVSQADAMIGQVLAELERQGELEHTLVIVTADHGEELGDHGLWEHNWMYQTNLRVPLVMALPGKLPAGRRVDALVESVDLVPTICALVGVEPPSDPTEPEHRGILDGVDLSGVIRGDAPSAKSFAFSENASFLAIQDGPRAGGRFKLVVRAGAQCQDGFALSLAETNPRKRPELYRLDTDPDERVNEIDRYPEEARRLLAGLCAHDQAMPTPQDEIVPTDRDEQDRMKLLGYTEGSPTGHASPDEGGKKPR